MIQTAFFFSCGFFYCFISHLGLMLNDFVIQDSPGLSVAAIPPAEAFPFRCFIFQSPYKHNLEHKI